LVLSTRRRLLGVAASVAVAVALAAGMSGRGCDAGDASPEGTVRAFVAAARSADRRQVWELLGPATRARVEAAAQAATEKVGGARRFGPLDVLDVSTPESTFAPSGVVLRDRRGDAAVVDVLGPDDRHDAVNLVKVGGRWKVELEF
jgi:hypothetical protein